MKKILKAFSLISVMLLCFSCNKTLPTEPGTNAISSLKKIGDRAYSLEYFGDYLLDALINADVKDETALRKYLESDIPNWKTYAEISSKLKISLPDDFACSSLVAANKDSAGGQIYGRNFDWFIQNPPKALNQFLQQVLSVSNLCNTVENGSRKTIPKKP